ncbi:hypothetical protein KJ359_012141 [Pestalotiopsis sp. 9143b]|nr:hypothetical protein KJ359_012141 [Pestalotiopsis sp. 9143b]
MTTLKPPPPPLLATPATTAAPLSLTIRFSASVPDLDLDIPHPSQTTVVSLKNLIRGRLAEPNSQRRLRFIQGGKILPDAAALGSVLRHRRLADGRGAQGRGRGGEPPGVRGVFAAAAVEPVAGRALAGCPGTPAPGTTSAATPRGFDRLLNAGFSAAEVNQLRLQFRSIHSSRFTPDTLPSPDSFRRMEDSWIDDNGAAVPTASVGTGAVGSGGGFDSDEVGLLGWLDAMIWGVTIGFLWPMGSFGWLTRQHGIHSDRVKVMIGAGVFLSLLIGIVRTISGEH